MLARLSSERASGRCEAGLADDCVEGLPTCMKCRDCAAASVPHGSSRGGGVCEEGWQGRKVRQGGRLRDVRGKGLAGSHEAGVREQKLLQRLILHGQRGPHGCIHAHAPTASALCPLWAAREGGGVLSPGRHACGKRRAGLQLRRATVTSATGTGQWQMPGHRNLPVSRRGGQGSRSHVGRPPWDA